MLLILFQLDFIIDVHDLSIYSDPDKARFFHFSDELLMLAFFPSHYGSKDLQLCPAAQGCQVVHHLVDGLLRYLFAALGTVRYSYSCIEKPEIIIYLSDGSYC
ncbi:hypothetical protein SDC9_168976 [bioreactor metagenome]|uniref:Uncharacterized protein n=1 Tax=bioreactor metagenome TaxID=1076179 RepID=A0A645G640_9ZZZZ